MVTHERDRSGHQPVMLQEVLDLLEPKDGETYVDGTLGGGGYTRAILEASDCRVHAFDRDLTAILVANQWRDRYADRLCLHNRTFCEMVETLESINQPSVDGVTLDLGVSSMQLDQPQRGFSFNSDGPLDMRMGETDFTAEQFVNQASVRELEDVIRVYGEEKMARRIAQRITVERDKVPIATTAQLAECVASAVPPNPRRKIHPATKTFQAIRILVNNELEELWRGLMAAERLLKPAGRLIVVAFHSLEDRLVKTFFAQRSGQKPQPSRYLPDRQEPSVQPSFYLPFRRPKTPSSEEIGSNSRSRSAKLRYGVRTEWAAIAGAFPGPSVVVGAIR